LFSISILDSVHAFNLFHQLTFLDYLVKPGKNFIERSSEDSSVATPDEFGFGKNRPDLTKWCKCGW
jgi:hypothetical protein